MLSQDENESDELQQMLVNEAAKLGEHFDSCIIICTKQFDDNHIRFRASSGSFYASLGAIIEFINKESHKSIEQKLDQ